MRTARVAGVGAGIAVCAACILAACVAARGPLIGQSVNPAGAGAAGTDRADGGLAAFEAGGPSPLAEWRASMTKLNAARFPSRGHAAGRWEIDVYANEAGAAALKGGDAVPPGARFVVEHFERDKPGPVMAMEKRPPGFDAEHGDWRYVVVGAAGDRVKDGVVESCAGCHGDAPRDHLFALTPDASAP